MFYVRYELFNENDMVSDFNASNVVDFVRQYDRTRLLDADSGGEGLAAQDAFRIGDANDFHAGVWPPQGPTAGATPTQYAMVAEYGGVSFVTPGHAFQSHSMGANGKVFNKDCDWAMIGPPLNSSLATATAIVDVMRYFAQNRTYSAGGLIQWTDIEAECDGVLNYDRLPKFSVAEAEKIRRMSVEVVGTPVACRSPSARPFEYPRWMLTWPQKTDDDATASSAKAAPTALQQRRFGVNIHFNSASSQSAAELHQAFSAVRQDILWGTVEAAEKGVYNWSNYDQLLADTGPSVLPYMILDYGNPLYNTDPSSQPPYPSVIAMNNTEARNGFVRYAIAAMRHFRGKNVLWELWNEPNGKWCCGHLTPAVYAALALAIADGKAALSPELDDERLAGPTTCGCDLAYMEAVWEAGGLRAFDAISWHPYRGGGPESVSTDYATVRALASKYLPAGGSPPPIISGEWGYATCFTDDGDPAPCVGGATGGNTVSRTQQGAFLARQWLVNAMEEVPLSIWYDWSDGNDCTVTRGTSDDCCGVFSNGTSADDQAAHGPAKPAYRAAVQMQRLIARRPFVQRLRTVAPPHGFVVEPPGSAEGSGCLLINAQVPTSAPQDAAGVYALAFGPASKDFPPAAAVPGAEIEALALWTVSDIETSTTVVEPSLATACFNRSSLWGIAGSHPYCFNATGHLHARLHTTPELYTRLKSDGGEAPLERGLAKAATMNSSGRRVMAWMALTANASDTLRQLAEAKVRARAGNLTDVSPTMFGTGPNGSIAPPICHGRPCKELVRELQSAGLKVHPLIAGWGAGPLGGIANAIEFPETFVESALKIFGSAGLRADGINVSHGTLLRLASSFLRAKTWQTKVSAVSLHFRSTLKPPAPSCV